MVHDNTPEEVRKDEEGLQIMRYLGRNMAWLLKLKEAGEKAGIELPAQEEMRISTNFITIQHPIVQIRQISKLICLDHEQFPGGGVQKLLFRVLSG